MRFLTVDDEIRTSLDALGAPDGTGQLTAARLFRKPSRLNLSPLNLSPLNLSPPTPVWVEPAPVGVPE
jgi:hypothetical protein